MENTATENVLDVTLLAPSKKHPAIFVRFDALQAGDTLTIHNDHDPKPLYYQLLAERGNVFSWEYLEQGPVWWKVTITRKHANESEETLGQIAAADLRKAEVFKKYGLDFCCGGKKTLKQACAEKGLDVTVVEQALQQVAKTSDTHALPFGEWKLDFLADYIVNTHHSYVKKSLPGLLEYAAKVASVHGAQHPELLRIQALVEAINEELLSHMMKEEKVLFPYIKVLVHAVDGEGQPGAVHFGTIQNPVSVMEAEHEMVGGYLAEINTLSNNYALPADACASYALLYKMLAAFEEDLHIHVHLENNMLFPKALKMEKQALS